MTAASRLLAAAFAAALFVASCGQKGPLVLPEEETGEAAAAQAPAALRLAQGHAACGAFPSV